MRKSLGSLCALLGLAVLSSLAMWAQTAPVKPITEKGLIDALRIGGLSPQELVQFVQQRGVDFQLTSASETSLRSAGAKPELIQAVRANFRAAAAAVRSVTGAKTAGPLGKSEIVTLLQVGTPTDRILQLVNERGIGFAMSPEIAGELTAAGADQRLLQALGGNAAPDPPAAPEPAAPADPGLMPPAAPGTAQAAPAPVPAGPALTSLREVHKIFVDKMPNDLDQYLRAEINKQLPGRLQVVLVKEEADAIMTGVGENRTGTGAAITGRYLGLHDNATGAVSVIDRSGRTVLWSDEAGDRSLLFGVMKKGGPRKVADRLIGKLKKALEQ